MVVEDYNPDDPAELIYALLREQIHVEFITYTSFYKQVWARDYMPAQL